MHNSLGERFQTFFLSLWAGGQLTVGYLVAPVLFASLPDDRALAGMLAGKMFSIIAWVGLVLALVLVVVYYLQQKSKSFAQWRFWSLAGLFVLSIVSLFVLQPMMAELKAQGIVAGSEIAKQFGKLHGISSGLYLLGSLLLASLVLAGLKTQAKTPRKRTTVGDRV
ncbi:MAG: DUF4149 domain-containing protein [Gammaproteobacteria bacterium]|nr:DUF4149 domain-containing protein [Gammaproteobacteria bacterium]